ncbi:Sec14p-like phosphatidylinositol transfer family protein [Striga asiatica]|uniref:Sec14p-like phosphatidylinositol transfer family protein n=1 Tax=Striga asiatica TaxID=4170 RepID=A0A5A7QYS5_STRAF|nr:Sec14p-like phosphatidylinositol transfer family protein [Striga asiatica]
MENIKHISNDEGEREKVKMSSKDKDEEQGEDEDMSSRKHKDEICTAKVHLDKFDDENASIRKQEKSKVVATYIALQVRCGMPRLEMVTDKEFFSPTLKNVLTSLTSHEKPTTIASSESTDKKRISFDNQQSSTPESSIPFTQIPESSTQQTHQTSTICDASPTKKSRPKMD